MLVVKNSDINYCRLVLDEKSAYDLQELLDSDYAFIADYTQKFDHPSFESVNKLSAVVPLMSRDINEVLGDFKSNARNEVRKTFKDDNLEFEFEPTDLEELYDFYAACEFERGWYPAPIEEIAASKVFSVKYNGEYLSGMTAYLGGETIRVGKIFSSRRNVASTELTSSLFSACSRRVVYEFCKWGIDNGYKFFDLAGIDPEDPSKKGITKFKLSFGSKVTPINLLRFKTEKFNRVFEEYKANKIDLT